MSKHFYEIDEILDFNPDTTGDWLKSASGIKLNSLRVKDLVFQNNSPIRSGNGVYIFTENNIALYVGSCVSRNFVERIPAHFDIRKNGWFNSLLVNLIRRTIGQRSNDNKTDENLEKSAKLAFQKLDLILINFTIYDKSAIKKLEDYLKITLKPLNGFKHKKLHQENLTIRDYIE